MHRIDSPTASPDENGTGKDGFRGATGIGVSATAVTPAFMNDLQEQPASVIEDRGMALVKGDFSQLSVALGAQMELGTLGGAIEEFDPTTAQINDAFMSYSGAPNLYAVGASGGIARSTDWGKTWTVLTPAAAYAGTFNRGAAGSLFSAATIIGTGGEIQYSSGGGFTHKAAAAAFAGSWSGLAVIPGVIAVLVGGISSDAAIQTTTSITSVAMTARTVPAGVLMLGDIHYANGLLVAVGGGASGVTKILTSTDGITWTVVYTGAVTSDRGFRVDYSERFGRWYVITEQRILSSADGASWTVDFVALTSVYQCKSLLVFDYCVVAVGANCSLVTRDGVTWEHMPAADRTSVGGVATLVRAERDALSVTEAGLAINARAVFFVYRGVTGFARAPWINW